MFVRDQNQVWPSLIDLYEGLVLFNEGRLFEAQRLCAAAQNFFALRPCEAKPFWPNCLLARIALRMNDHGCRRCATASRPRGIRNFDSPLLLYQAEFLMGEIERAGAKRNEAYKSYRRAREAMEHVAASCAGKS